MKAQAMEVRRRLTEKASSFSESNKGKTYEDAVWEEVAMGLISDTEAIQKIDSYNRQSNNEKLNTLIKLRNEGFITDEEIAWQKQILLPMSNSTNIKYLEHEPNASSVDQFYEEE